MGILLILFLSCFVAEQYPLLKVNGAQTFDTFAIGPPIQKATWKDNPIIRVCTATEVSAYRVQKAIKFWEMLGYKFNGVFMDHSADCMIPHYGEIVVTLPEGSMGDNQIAATRIYTEKATGHIAQAKIFVYPKYARQERVIEHELGHALGWRHHKQKFHMMHPDWQLGGYDYTGLRR